MLSDTRLSALAQIESNKALTERPQPQSPALAEALSSEQKDLRSYLSLIYRRKWMILSVVVIVTTLVALYVYRLPSV